MAIAKAKEYGLASSFFDTSRFSGKTSQVEQTRSSYLTSAENFNFFYVRRKYWKNTLRSNLVRYFSNGEGFTSRTSISALQNYALKLLDTFFGTLPDFYVDVHRVASSERRDRRALLRVFLLY